MRTKFVWIAVLAVGVSVSPLTTARSAASFVTDSVKLTIKGTGFGPPAPGVPAKNFPIDVSGTAVVKTVYDPEFLFTYPQFLTIELAVDVGPDWFELRFVRTGSFGELPGPVTWTLSDLDWIGSPQVRITSLALLPQMPDFRLPVQSFSVIDGRTVQVVTGPTGPTANQNARFQFGLSPVPQPVPEPSALVIGCSGLACLFARRVARRPGPSGETHPAASG
jgi:hypothetical protein